VSTPLERLLAESIPVRPAPAPNAPRRAEPGRQWTREQQDAHWNALCAAVGATREQRPARHLHAVPPAA
jgi:hypothetical protein